MKAAMVIFPGSNYDVDLYETLRSVCHADVEYVSHWQKSLAGFDAVMLPRGFSYGDYLRAGAIARFTDIMPAMIRMANGGKPVFGTCNGSQILTETGFLPGELRRNDSQHFVCRTVPLEVVDSQTLFTSHYQDHERIALPVVHADDSYYIDEKTLDELEANNQIVFRYATEDPNGSLCNIAGITNKHGSVLGMIPHPERAVETILDSTDGLRLFESSLKNGRIKVEA